MLLELLPLQPVTSNCSDVMISVLSIWQHAQNSIETMILILASYLIQLFFDQHTVQHVAHSEAAPTESTSKQSAKVCHSTAQCQQHRHFYNSQYHTLINTHTQCDD
jgi:hypothetical protein